MNDRADALLRWWLALADDLGVGHYVAAETRAYLAEPPRTETLAWCIENAVPGDVLIGKDGLTVRCAVRTPWGDWTADSGLRLDDADWAAQHLTWHTLRTSAGSIRIAEAEQALTAKEQQQATALGLTAAEYAECTGKAAHLPGVICDGPCCDEPLAVGDWLHVTMWGGLPCDMAGPIHKTGSTYAWIDSVNGTAPDFLSSNPDGWNIRIICDQDHIHTRIPAPLYEAGQIVLRTSQSFHEIVKARAWSGAAGEWRYTLAREPGGAYSLTDVPESHIGSPIAPQPAPEPIFTDEAKEALRAAQWAIMQQQPHKITLQDWQRYGPRSSSREDGCSDEYGQPAPEPEPSVAELADHEWRIGDMFYRPECHLIRIITGLPIQADGRRTLALYVREDGEPDQCDAATLWEQTKDYRLGNLLDTRGLALHIESQLADLKQRVDSIAPQQQAERRAEKCIFCPGCDGRGGSNEGIPGIPEWAECELCKGRGSWTADEFTALLTDEALREAEAEAQQFAAGMVEVNCGPAECPWYGEIERTDNDWVIVKGWQPATCGEADLVLAGKPRTPACRAMIPMAKVSYIAAVSPPAPDSGKGGA